MEQSYSPKSQFGDLKGAVDRAKRHRAPGSIAGRAALLGAGILTAAGGLAAVAADYAAEQRELAPPEEYVAGRVIVKFDREIDLTLQADGNVVTGIAEVDALNEEISGESYEQLVPQSDEHDIDNYYIIDVPLDVELDELVRDFSRIDEVEFVQYDAIFHAPEVYSPEIGEQCTTSIEQTLPNDKYFPTSGSWGQDFEDQWGPIRSGAREAWEITTGNPDLVFAVLDTGVDHTHPDLRAKMWTREDGTHGYNFVQGNTDTMDRYGHGTHVAGIIAGDTNNEIGIAGLNWQGKVMAVKVCGDTHKDGCSGTAVIRGIVYAASNGAHVINMSLGGLSGPWDLPGNLAIDYAYYKGVIIVASAGNSNDDTAKYWPANNPYTLAVAAIDHNGRKTSFSNWGETVDVAAPGLAILSTVPEKNQIRNYPIIDKIYAAWAGTSFSAPHVSGEVGLILAANPRLIGNYAAVRSIVRQAVNPYDSDTYIGTGRIDYGKAVNLAVTYDTND